jgi:arylsulfatase A-like enzyme
MHLEAAANRGVPPARIGRSGFAHPLSPRAALVLGSGLGTGWCLYDLGVFATSASPQVALEILPGCALAVVAAAVFGWLVGRRFAAASGVALAALAFDIAVRGGVLRAGADVRALAQALALACVGVLLARPLSRSRVGALRAGFTAGVLACGTAAILRMGSSLHAAAFFPAAAGVLALGLVRRRLVRRVATALVLALAAVPVVRRVQSAAHLRADLDRPPAVAGEDRPSLVIAVLDTVRADHLSPYGYRRVTTPNLDAFAREHATRFTEARSTSPWTLPAHGSLLTGLFPSEHGADHPRSVGDRPEQIASRPANRLREDVPTLAEDLRAAGYRTGAVVANWAYLDRRFGLDRGFERYDDARAGQLGDYRALVQFFGHRPRSGRLMYRDARAITGRALAWLGSLPPDEPFFLLLNYMDVHRPRLPPAPFDHAFGALPESAARREREELSYDRALLHIDAELGRLFDWLRERGAFETSVIVVTSDHGEAFGEHGFWTHAWTLYDELLRVPLFVKPVGERARELELAPFSLRELRSLALALVGLEVAPLRAELVPVAEWYASPPDREIRRWADATGRDLSCDLLAWIDGNVKYIVASSGTVEAFDLDRDPLELAPLALAPRELEAARKRARTWWESHPPVGKGGLELDRDHLDGLRALGYLGEK